MASDRRRRSRIGIALAALVLSIGCAGGFSGSASEEPSPNRTALLQHELAALSENADAGESHLLAEAAIRHSRSLAGEYRLAHPPILHNLLVNAGLKERGLCWHWTEDLLDRLGELPLPSYQLHWGIAHRGKIFREHNSVIVTARGREFTTGIVLDPWRDSGELYWVSVGRESYPWEPH